MWSFAAVLYLLFVFRFSLCERKTKYSQGVRCLAAEHPETSQPYLSPGFHRDGLVEGQARLLLSN
jgi:hypothetical protein